MSKLDALIARMLTMVLGKKDGVVIVGLCVISRFGG
jgi:hypothetical protein